MKTRAQTAAVLAAFVLASCSGGGRMTPAPSGGGSGQTAKTQFVVHWPAKNAKSGLRKTQSISASAQSISITVNSGTPQIANNPGGGTSSIPIDAPVGTDTFVIKAWDEANGQGNVLDAATVSQLIVANATNTVNATLDGVCAALLATPVANQPFLETTTSQITLPNNQQESLVTGLRLVGTQPESFTVTPVDADGNALLSSNGPVVVNVAETGGTAHVGISSSQSGGVTTVTLTPKLGEPSGQTTTLSISSSQCGSGTPWAPNSVALNVIGAVYVGDTQSVYAFDQDGNSILSVATGYPISGVAWDSTHNQLDVVTSSGPTTGFGQLYVYTPALSQIATGAFNVTVQKNSKTTCNALAQIAVQASGNILVACPSTTPGTNKGFIRVVSVGISGGVATTADITPASPKWTQSGTALYDPVSPMVEPNGDVAVADAQSSGYFFDPNGNYLNAGYNYFTSYAYDPELQNVWGANSNNVSIWQLTVNTQTYLNNWSVGATPILVAFDPADQYLYALTSQGGVTVYAVHQATYSTLPQVVVPGTFAGLAAPVQAVSTI